MKRNTRTHPKLLDLASNLDIPLWGAVGILESLWLFTQQHAQRGDIGRHTDAAIARALDWRGGAGRLVTELVRAGWVDICPCHRLRIHDWHDHADEGVRRSFEVRARGFLECYTENARTPRGPSLENASIMRAASEENASIQLGEENASISRGESKTAVAVAVAGALAVAGTSAVAVAGDVPSEDALQGEDIDHGTAPDSDLAPYSDPGLEPEDYARAISETAERILGRPIHKGERALLAQWHRNGVPVRVVIGAMETAALPAPGVTRSPRTLFYFEAAVADEFARVARALQG